MDAPEPLFDSVGVPWQIVVHHQMRALQVDAFASRVGRQEDLHRRSCRKASAPSSVPHGLCRRGCMTTIRPSRQRRDALSQVIQRVAVFGEDDEFLVQAPLPGSPLPPSPAAPLGRGSFTAPPGAKISQSKVASSRHFLSVPLRRMTRASPSRCFSVSISLRSSTIVRAAVAWSRICSSAASTSVSGASSRSSTLSASSAGA